MLSVAFACEVCFLRCRATTTTWWPRWSTHCVRNMAFPTRWKQCGKASLTLSGTFNNNSHILFTARMRHVEDVISQKHMVFSLRRLPKERYEQTERGNNLCPCRTKKSDGAFAWYKGYWLTDVLRVFFFLRSSLFRSLKNSGDLWLDAYLHKWPFVFPTLYLKGVLFFSSSASYIDCICVVL